MEGSAVTYIPFDKVEFDYGNNYNPATGVYTVPRDGLYLFHARVNGQDNLASHYIKVDGDVVTFTYEYDEYQYLSASTSVVLNLLAGQEEGVDPLFSGTIDGQSDHMRTSFGATLLYPN